MAEEYAPDAEEAAIAEDGEPELSDSYVDDEGIFNPGDEFYDNLDAEFEAMPTGARSGNQVAITNASASDTYVNPDYGSEEHEKLDSEEPYNASPLILDDEHTEGELIVTRGSQSTEEIYGAEFAEQIEAEQADRTKYRKPLEAEETGAARNLEHHDPLKIYDKESTLEQDIAKGEYEMDPDAPLATEYLDGRDEVDRSILENYYLADERRGRQLSIWDKPDYVNDETVNGEVKTVALTKKELEARTKALYDDNGDYNRSIRSKLNAIGAREQPEVEATGLKGRLKGIWRRANNYIRNISHSIDTQERESIAHHNRRIIDRVREHNEGGRPLGSVAAYKRGSKLNATDRRVQTTASEFGIDAYAGKETGRVVDREEARAQEELEKAGREVEPLEGIVDGMTRDQIANGPLKRAFPELLNNPMATPSELIADVGIHPGYSVDDILFMKPSKN